MAPFSQCSHHFLASRYLQANVNIGLTISSPRYERNDISPSIVYVIRTARKAVFGLRYRELDELCVTWPLCLD
jgi:hypothetical protein